MNGLAMTRQRPVGRTFLAAAVALAGLLIDGCGYVAGEGGLAPVSSAADASPRRVVPERFSFMFMADPHVSMKADFLDQWKGAIAVVNRLAPDFVVVGGDLVNARGNPAKRDMAETERMASAYLDAAKALSPAIPLYNVPGNHDVGNTPTRATYAWYEERFGKPWYSFEHKGSLFVVFDSNVLKNPQQLPGVAERQLAWLEGALRGTGDGRYFHKIAFMHHPFCLKSLDEKENYNILSREMRSRLLALFKEHGVEAVFSGHYHKNARVEAEGIDFVTTTAVKRSIGGPPGFRIVKVTPEGIEHSFHSWDNAPERLP